MLQALNPLTQGRKIAAWLALFAVFFGAVAPAVSHALIRADAQMYGAEICTSTGMHWVAAAQSAPADIDAATAKHLAKAFAFNHCPFCLHSATHGVLPLHSFAYLFVNAGGTQVPVSRQAFFYVDDSRIWAPPRGPPAMHLQA
jgi:hypothetical protein